MGFEPKKRKKNTPKFKLDFSERVPHGIQMFYFFVLQLWADSDGSGSKKKPEKPHLVPKNMVRILKSNVQYHKVFSKIFLQFFLFPIRKNAWIKIFFTKFEGNIDNIRGEAENISILPKNLMKKKSKSKCFTLLENKKNCRKTFSNT